MAEGWRGEETAAELIARARERLGKSQYALAEALRGASGRGDGVPDRGMVARWETGRRIPTPYWRVHLTAILRLPADALDQAAAVSRAQRTGERREFTVGLTPDDEDRLAYVARHPRRIDATTVEALSAVLSGQRRAEDVIGSGPVLGPVLAQLAVAENLVAEARGPIRPVLVHAASQWAQFAGWLRACTGRIDEGDMLLDRALRWAIEAGEPNLISEVLSFKGHLAWLAARPGPMIGLSQAAQRDRSAYPGQLAISAAQEAQGHALAGDSGEVDQLLDEADEQAAAARERPEDAPLWLYYHSPAFFDLQRGLAYRYLGRHNRARNRQAIDGLAAGLAGLDPEARGSEWAAEYACQLAIAHIQAGSAENACAVASDVALITRQTESVRLRSQLDRLFTRLTTRWPDVPAVEELGDALRAGA